ncbi:NUDIX hydrolase [Bifidobacterium panos]|uniref:NUDIX domain-containing protein n=1 Tax=Bifidobacterium panos TaxID=2675321 RepID=A0ABX1SX87_9BIFI|nr:NUDIX hydrolase [Bifidobacterium sp. DSM 109963]NMN02451.1 NUDIX domain-containing protein [Bifidobacterium sp. DSM 109963]
MAEIPERYAPDPLAPLEIRGERQVFREHGGADFTVTAIDTSVRKTGKSLTLHVASVKDAQPGAVCIAVRPAAPGNTNVGNANDVDAFAGIDSCQILLARHWRASTGKWEWEFPRGMGEPGENAEQTAAREFREETGIAVDASCVRTLQTMHADTGVLRDNIAVTYFPVSTDTETAGETDGELSNFVWIGIKQMRHLIADGQLVDGITLASFMVFIAHLSARAEESKAR